MLTAALEGWDYPVTREAAILMDLWDLEYAKSGAKKANRYSRPWATPADEIRHGKPRPRSEVVEILNRFGHAIPV